MQVLLYQNFYYVGMDMVIQDRAAERLNHREKIKFSYPIMIDNIVARGTDAICFI